MESGAPGQGGTTSTRLIVVELLDLYLDHVHRTLKPATYTLHRDSCKSFAAMHGRLVASEVRPLHVTAWLAAHPTWNPTTKHMRAVAVCRGFRWAVREGHLEGDTLKGVRLPRSQRREFLPESDAASILEAASRQFRAYLECLVETGARPGELETATAAGWDATEGTLKVSGKTGERALYLSPRAAELVEAAAAEHPTGLLFRTPRGHPWTRNNRYETFRRIAKKGGAKGCAYAMRHLFASQAVHNEVDVLTLAHLLGHKNLKMLMDHYFHPSPEHLRDSIKRARAGASTPTSAAPADEPTRPEPTPGPPRKRRSRR